MTKFFAFFFLTLIYSRTFYSQEIVLIKNANYLDVEKGRFVKASILIEEGKIKKIAKKINSNEAKEIDASEKWIIPGLVEAHMHLFQSGGIYTRPDAFNLTNYVRYEDEVKWVRENAADILKRYLRCGITTVIDVGGPMTNFDIREECKDKSEYPNLFVTGPLVSTYQPDAFKIKDAPIVEVHTPEEARALVKKQLPYNPDFIKIWYIVQKDAPADSTYAIVKATIDESHANGLSVAVHATQLHTAKLAIKAGADILVHSVDDEVVDKAFIQAIKENDIVYVPTMIVNGNYLKTFSQTKIFSEQDFAIAPPAPLGSYFDLRTRTSNLLELLKKSGFAAMQKRVAKSDSVKKLNLDILSRNGIDIATGTDAGNPGTYHGSSYNDEVDAMKKVGLSNLEILQYSTINGAKVVSKEQELGSITVGKWADMVFLNTNPLENLEALKDISLVIKNGKEHPVDSIVSVTPVTLVQQQLNAYNARNIDAFLDPYSDSVELYDFPNTLKSKGKETMRTNYTSFFKQVPNLHCEVVNRTILGNTVIDQERVRGFEDGKILEATAIYKIQEGKIAQVYFIRK